MDALRLVRPLLCAAALLAAAPAAAGAQSVSEDGCRQSGGPRVLCVGAGKLGERVSAECRRLGIADDATCWSRVGRRVVREEVDAYEGSWLNRTLAFQHDLGDAVPFVDAPWIGTHNSFNSTSEPPTLSHTDSNQQLSLTDQLRLDVRSLEVDVHWLPSPHAGGREAAVVCHGEGDAGCTTERLLADVLIELRDWLDAHPEQVLLVYLEDQIDADQAAYDAAANVVREALGDRVYVPPASQSECRELPLGLTRSVVRQAERQVVIVSDCGKGGWSGLVHGWPGDIRHEDRPRGYTTARNGCGGIERSTYDGKLVRFYEDSTFFAPATEPTGFSSTDDGLRPDTVRAMVACGVDVFGFDQLLPGDGRHEALVWSWADGQPVRPRRMPRGTVQRPGGRWETRLETRRFRPACQDAQGDWTVLARRVPRRAAADACAAAGLTLGTPRTGRQNHELVAAKPRRSTVWLAHRPS